MQVIFEFRSTVVEGNNTAAGTVIQCCQYNPANALFTSKSAMENYEYAHSHKVTDSSHFGVECDPGKRGGSPIEYVRTDDNYVGDIKNFDLGKYQLAINGCPAQTIGELWVHYTVRLSKSKIFTALTTGYARAYLAAAGTGTVGCLSPNSTTVAVPWSSFFSGEIGRAHV